MKIRMTLICMLLLVRFYSTPVLHAQTYTQEELGKKREELGLEPADSQARDVQHFFEGDFGISGDPLSMGYEAYHVIKFVMKLVSF